VDREVPLITLEVEEEDLIQVGREVPLITLEEEEEDLIQTI
jgi:hypothetical protein